MQWLKEWVEREPHRLCINEYSYDDIYRAVIYVAKQLDSVLANTKRIAIISDNSVTMAVYILASMLLHKEILLLNVHLKPSEIEKQLDVLQVSTVISSTERMRQIPSTAERVIPFDEQVLKYMDWKTAEDLSQQDVLLDFEGDQSIVEEFNWQFIDDDVVVIMNTSATSGVFKSVPIRWGQIQAHVAASQQVLGVDDKDNWLVVLPLFHVSGLSILMRSLYNGTAMTILPSYDEERVLQLIEDKEITMMSLVPTLLQRLEPSIKDHALRVILLGGEFIHRPLIDTCVAKQLPIYKTYGMTETFSQSVTMPVLSNLDNLDSVGLPLPGMTVHIANPDADGIGEILLEGPMVMTGYYGKEPIHGVFNTNDIGYIDDDGYVYILNRRTDLIISGGENIYPKEIEDLLYAHHMVKECAVVPVVDDTWGQVPALFVSIHEGNGDSKEFVTTELQQYMLQHLAKYKVPKYITILPQLPRNGTGKIMRKELATYLEND
ncbi:o-succinylbenzoate--CoA ligase [Veillonella agrestimuris]|uniref:o-succinylbenzoate--CoA ligase n=1 Tax=Veillonella agrestimuris TaxID=2941340 RepID=UPI00203E9D94|nr:o-succinylbenzoate--CoA ligase [Veillonella agrestimuris]